MNYLITGASGFIGKRLVQLLLSQGHGVNYTARKRDTNMDSRAAFVPWHAQEEPTLNTMGRLDGIVHLAGEPVAQRWNAEVKQRIRDSRVAGTHNLVSAIGKLKHRPKVLVSASAIGYYGDNGDRVITEETPRGAGFLADVCAEWENEASRAAEFGVRVVTPRISIVLGPDGGALPKMLPSFRLGAGGTLGNGKQWMPWIQADDMARLLQFAIDNEQISGPMNAASPNPVSNIQFTRELAQAVHRPAWFRIPEFALTLALGEVAHHMLESMRVVPQIAENNGFQFLYPHLRGALQACLSRTGSEPAKPAQTVVS